MEGSDNHAYRKLYPRRLSPELTLPRSALASSVLVIKSWLLMTPSDAATLLRRAVSRLRRLLRCPRRPREDENGDENRAPLPRSRLDRSHSKCCAAFFGLVSPTAKEIVADAPGLTMLLTIVEVRLSGAGTSVRLATDRAKSESIIESLVHPWSAIDAVF
jgi:hypothetical protein